MTADEACPSPRTYFVVSPETQIHHASELEPPEYGRYVDEVKASTKREAIRVAYANPKAEIHEWAKIARGDGRHPFSGVTVEHPHCEHGTCLDLWSGDLPTDAECPQCAEQFAVLEAEQMS